MERIYVTIVTYINDHKRSKHNLLHILRRITLSWKWDKKEVSIVPSPQHQLLQPQPFWTQTAAAIVAAASGFPTAGSVIVMTRE